MAYRVALAASLAVGITFSFQSYYASLIGTVTDLLTPTFAAVAGLSAALALSKYTEGIGTRSAQVWLSFTMGILLWFLGELTWSVYALVFKVPIPYPSLADAFYLAGYIPLFLGFYLYVFYFKPAISRSTFMIVVALIATSVVVVFSLLLNPVLGMVEDPVTWFFDFAYPISDLVLLAVAILGLALFAKGRLGAPWLFLNVGVLLNVFADLTFSYSTARGTYYSGSLTDAVFLLGYVCFALAFRLHRYEF